jgi:hypothetical protein
MNKTMNNIDQICTHDEFERFRYFHELFARLMKDHNLPKKQLDQLFEDVNNFEKVIVPIAQKIGIDLSKHTETINDIWEQLGIWPDPLDVPFFVGDEYGEAISNYVGEQENRLDAWKESIADIDKVMVKLYASQPEDKNQVPILIQNSNIISGSINQADNLQVGDDPQINEINIKEENNKGILIKVMKIGGTIVLSIIAAVVTDILGDFGMIESIKTIIYRIIGK